MYRITGTTLVRRDGSIERSNEVVEVKDLEEYRARVKGSKYVNVNFIFSEIDDNEGDCTDSESTPVDESSKEE